MFAMMVLAVVLALALFLGLQRYFMRGLTSRSLKG
jgi:ABC-type glycerol-3-phosphate transport system permease component